MDISINVDAVIEKYNKENPEKRKMTRDSLVEQLETKLTTTTIRNWQSSNFPKALLNLGEIMVATNSKLSDILSIKHEGKELLK